MNQYTMKDLEAGQEEAFAVTVTEDMLNQFRTITGDTNPLHQNAEFAKAKGYTDKVVFGMLTASFLSTLAGVYLPGENSLIHSVETKFLKPVLVGDVLRISGTVAEKDERFSLILIKVLIRNQNNEKVLKGSMKVMVNA